MVSKRIIIGIVLIMALVLQIGCSMQNNQQDTQEDTQKAVMEEFGQLVDSGAELAEVIGFIDGNAAQLSEENVSIMLDRFEELQIENLPKLDEKFYSSQDIQNQMNEIYEPGFDMNSVDQVEHKELRDLLSETRDTGYKVETAEGMYFPIVDYQFYKKYSSNVTANMKEYINMMAVESDKVPAKDAALIIGWDEVLERALRQEKFIEQYPDSMKADQVRQLYRKYVSFTVFGANNTPLFSYDTNIVVDDAKAVYTQAAEGAQSSEYLEIIREYLEVLEKNNFKLTDEVDKYRKSVYESI